MDDTSALAQLFTLHEDHHPHTTQQQVLPSTSTHLQLPFHQQNQSTEQCKHITQPEVETRGPPCQTATPRSCTTKHPKKRSHTTDTGIENIIENKRRMMSDKETREKELFTSQLALIEMQKQKCAQEIAFQKELHLLQLQSLQADIKLKEIKITLLQEQMLKSKKVD